MLVLSVERGFSCGLFKDHRDGIAYYSSLQVRGIASRILEWHSCRTTYDDHKTKQLRKFLCQHCLIKGQKVD